MSAYETLALEPRQRMGPTEAGRGAAPIWRLVLQRTSPIVLFNSNSDGPAFYCVHSVAGDVGDFRTLAQLLGPKQGFYGIQVPHNCMNADFAASIERIAEHHVETLIEFQPEGPIVLGGYSAGAIIALEMAHQLRAIGREVPLLVALDGAPSNTGGGISRRHPLYAWKLLCNLPRWVRKERVADWSFASLSRRLINKFVYRGRPKTRVLKYAQTLQTGTVQGLLAKQGWAEGQSLFIQALFDAMAAYVPRPYDGRVIVYETKTQQLFRLLQIAESWRKIAPQSDIVSIDGSHGTILRDPAALAADLRQRLAKLHIAYASPPDPEMSARITPQPLQLSA